MIIRSHAAYMAAIIRYTVLNPAGIVWLSTLVLNPSTMHTSMPVRRMARTAPTFAPDRSAQYF